MPTLSLSERHDYALDGREVLGVSRILEAAGLVDTAFMTEAGRRRGSHTHKVVEYYVKDELEETSVHPDLVGYLAAYQKFERESGFVVEAVDGIYQVEISRYHPVYDYAGTPDLVGSIGDRRLVVDIKSGAPDESHKEQLALYAMLFDPSPRPDRANLYLRPDGTYRFVERRDRQDFENAKAALTVARLRLGRGLLKART